jgi:hypothetical protein
MSVAQQAIAARRKAKKDTRYAKLASRDAGARARRYAAMLQKQKDMVMRKGMKKR